MFSYFIAYMSDSLINVRYCMKNSCKWPKILILILVIIIIKTMIMITIMIIIIITKD